MQSEKHVIPLLAPTFLILIILVLHKVPGLLQIGGFIVDDSADNRFSETEEVVFGCFETVEDKLIRWPFLRCLDSYILHFHLR